MHGGVEVNFHARANSEMNIFFSKKNISITFIFFIKNKLFMKYIICV
jgi:hypothetical protein